MTGNYLKMVLNGIEPHSSLIIAISVLCDWTDRQHIYVIEVTGSTFMWLNWQAAHLCDWTDRQHIQLPTWKAGQWLCN